MIFEEKVRPDAIIEEEAEDWSHLSMPLRQQQV